MKPAITGLELVESARIVGLDAGRTLDGGKQGGSVVASALKSTVEGCFPGPAQALVYRIYRELTSKHHGKHLLINNDFTRLECAY